MPAANSTIVVTGVDGSTWTIAGPNAPDRGVFLVSDPKGFYDPPVKAVYEEPGNFPGSRYLSHRILRRDITFAVDILGDDPDGSNPDDSWLTRDSQWRKAWAFDADTTITITTDESGSRSLKVRLLESPEVSLAHEPIGHRLNRCSMTVVAGDPFWYGADELYYATTLTDTSFDPTAHTFPWDVTQLPTETLTITVDPSDGKGGVNPTDQIVWPKWGLPGSTQAPSVPYIPGVPWLGAPESPAVIWTIPDYSFKDDDQADQRVQLPGLIGGLRTNAVQQFIIDGLISDGYFTLSYDGVSTGVIEYGASPADVEAALLALASIAEGDISVTWGNTVNEVQRWTVNNAIAGTYVMKLGDAVSLPIGPNAGFIDVNAALDNFNNIGLLALSILPSETDAVQEIALVGEPTDGSFKIGYQGYWTEPIHWNASSLEMWIKLSELPGIGAFQVTVEKDWKPYAPWKITFNGSATHGLGVPLFTYDVDTLAGGAGIDITITQTTAGTTSYTAYFAGGASGENVPQMTADTTELVGPGASVTVSTSTDGAKPYIVTFQGNLSGVDVPQLAVNTGLLNGIGVGARVQTVTPGKVNPAENVIVDTDPRFEQIVAENGSPIWQRMNGVRLVNSFPAWTKSATFKVNVSGAVPGQMISLRIPRVWSRPWGLE